MATTHAPEVLQQKQTLHEHSQHAATPCMTHGLVFTTSSRCHEGAVSGMVGGSTPLLPARPKLMLALRPALELLLMPVTPGTARRHPHYRIQLCHCSFLLKAHSPPCAHGTLAYTLQQHINFDYNRGTG